MFYSLSTEVFRYWACISFVDKWFTVVLSAKLLRDIC